MKKVIEQLDEIIELYGSKLRQLSEEDLAEKTNPEKWSRKEELGHLIDSAHNNLRRFIVTQYETQPKIIYDQNFWNQASNYQHQSSNDLITLWVLVNKQIRNVLETISFESWSKLCDTGKQNTELHNIEWLAEDYNKHMLHHLHHLLALEPVPY